MKLKYCLILLVLCGAYLAIKGLDNSYFWDDEAESAVFARNYLNFGKLTAWDGRNLYSFRNGTVVDENLRPRNAPLVIVVCAASFKIFGMTTWAARFPFAIIGLISIWVFYLLLKNDFGEDEWLWLYMVGGFALSTAFLLSIRNCRYYSLSILFSLCTYYGYRRCLVTKEIKYYLLIVFASVLSFYANPMICSAFLASIGVVHLVFNRKEFTTKDWKMIVGMAILFLSLTASYAIYYRIWYRPDVYPEFQEPLLFHHTILKESWFHHRLVLIGWYLTSVNFMTCFPWPIAVGLLICLINYPNLPVSRTILQWIVLIISHIIFIALISPQLIYSDAIADIRYLVASMPFLIGLTGVFLWFVSRWKPVVGIVLFIIYITSNILTLNPIDYPFNPLMVYVIWALPSIIGLLGIFLWFTKRIKKPVATTLSIIFLTSIFVTNFSEHYGFKWLLPGLIYEVHHDYPTAISAVTQFLKQHAKQDDTVACNPDYNDYPVMFYLGDKIKICGTLNKKTLLLASVLAGINAPLFVEDNYPDWIIYFGDDPDRMSYLNYFERTHQENGKTMQYHYIPYTQLDYYWFATNRPEINWHTFGPKLHSILRGEAVYIYQKTVMDKMDAVEKQNPKSS